MNNKNTLTEKKRERISILVPTFNEEKNIRDCLESVKWADEIVIVDSYSYDNTVKIAREYTDKILQHEYINSASQKNWAIPQLSNEWIMIVDSDERVTPELKEEILKVLTDGTSYNGFYIYRKNHFLAKEIKHCGWNKDKCLRLFRKGMGKYQEREVHADIILEGKVGYLKNKLIHYTFDSFAQYIKKWDRYTSWASIDRGKKTKRVRWYYLTLRPLWRFIKQYILKLGFLDGKEGYIICKLAAMSVFMKYAKLLERKNSENHFLNHKNKK